MLPSAGSADQIEISSHPANVRDPLTIVRTFPGTRTYAQDVLENAVIYDLYNQACARTPANNRLSFHLGKPSGG